MKGMKVQKLLLASLGVVLVSQVGCGGESAKTQVASVASAPSVKTGMDSKCDKILDGDLFNKISSKENSHQKDLAQIRFFLLNEDEAYEVYKAEKQSSSGGNGNLGVNVFEIVEVQAGGGGNKTLTFNEFKEGFKRAKRLFQQEVNTEKYSEVTNVYSSFVRDASSVEAWSSCVQMEILNDPNSARFLMTLIRQDSEKVQAKIRYNAGVFSGLIPKLDIEFFGATSTQSGKLQIGQGEKVFQLKKEDDSEAISVTGSSPDGLINFSYSVNLPVEKTEFDHDRCLLQNTMMVLTNKIGYSEFVSLNKAGYVTYTDSKTGRLQGSGTCSSWLNNN
jgi:hypothetical protein